LFVLRQTGTTDYTGAFKSYDITPEEQELKEWAPARVARRSVDLPHKYVYVQQATAPTPAVVVQKISVYLI
jgi:hypothetical protein